MTEPQQQILAKVIREMRFVADAPHNSDDPDEDRLIVRDVLRRWADSLTLVAAPAFSRTEKP